MKVNLKIKLIGEENLDFECVGIKNNNTIKYLENNLVVCLTYINDALVIKRSNSEYQVTINLNKNKNTISTYDFVGGNKTFELNTKTTKLVITDSKIDVEYNLEGNEFKFFLEVIE